MKTACTSGAVRWHTYTRYNCAIWHTYTWYNLGFRPTFDDIAPFAGEHLSQMKALTAASFSESLLLPLNGSTRNALCEELLQYLSYHTEANIQVKSLAVLRELYR